PIDDQYWREHGPTPKAFVSLALGRRLWSSRFGQTTSIRVAPPAGLADLRRKLRIDPAALGLVFQPVRQQGLAASAGSTPFDVLFLAFSSFIIAAAVILVGLLFRLGVERRATEAGILLAIGMAPRRLGRLLAAEGLLLATIGSLVGVAGAIVYAAILLLGLRTWWLAAVNTPRLRLYVTPQSLLLGYAVGLVVAFAVIAWSVRRMAGIPPRRLLAGSIAAAEMSRPENTSPKRKRGSQIRALLPIPPSLALRASVVLDLAAALLILAPAVVLMNLQLGDEAQAGAFFAVGALALTVLMSLAWIHLRAGRTGAAVAPGRGNLLRLAVRNAARNPGRSALSMGLIAAACFVIVAVAAFHAEPPQGSPLLAGGSGGFALVAECDQPVYQDLNTHEGRMQLGFSDADDRLLAGCTIFALRAKAGDDASCRNLYQPRQPRLLGVTPRLIARGGFAWVGASAALPNPWRLLDETAGAGQDVPMILDGTTATYALHLEGPDAVYEIDDSQGRKVRLRVAALLADSIFQGDLLVSETALLRIDPQLGGYRFFLIEAPAEKLPQVRGALEETLGDYGFAAETTGQRLAAFMAVENTYLAAFQSLGGLGLLLGTIGLGAVQLRNVLERRGELALLRAAGFRRRALVELVLLENMLLLLAGLIAGILAALVAILPHLVGRAATIPWHSLAATLLLVLAVGLLASLAAVRTVLSAPLWKALGEQR
ncbi:MAG: ABC transporter permease, partial [Thermoguttaceae bacterium]